MIRHQAHETAVRAAHGDFGRSGSTSFGSSTVTEPQAYGFSYYAINRKALLLLSILELSCKPDLASLTSDLVCTITSIIHSCIRAITRTVITAVHGLWYLKSHRPRLSTNVNSAAAVLLEASFTEPAIRQASTRKNVLRRSQTADTGN